MHSLQGNAVTPKGTVSQLLGVWAVLLAVGMPLGSHASPSAHGVLIDVGHSIKRPGAVSASGTPEFDFNVSLAKEVARALEMHSVTPTLLGADGKLGDLTERVRLVKASDASFVLSIHHDSVQPQFLSSGTLNGVPHRFSRHAQGFSLFVSPQNRQAALSLKCAAAIGAALENAGFRASRHHAELVAGENRAWADERNGVYYADFAILKTAPMAAVLLEAGVIVNPEEEQRLREAHTQSDIATAVAMGLTACGAVSGRGLENAETSGAAQKQRRNQ